jgi:hypothetical protein
MGQYASAKKKLSRYNKVILVWILGHHGIPGNKKADKLAEDGTNGVPPNQTVGISFVVDKEVIRSHLRQERQNRWKTCKGCRCRQSETLMSEPVSSRTKGPQTISRQKLQVAVGLLADHTTLRAQMFKLGLTQRQDFRLCGDEKKTVYILYVTVRHWHAKDTEPWAVGS